MMKSLEDETKPTDGVLNPKEQSIREEILSGLLADKGGDARAGGDHRE